MKFAIPMLAFLILLGGCLPKEIAISQPPSSGPLEQATPFGVNQSDIWRKDYTRIYFHNAARGLHVLVWFDYQVGNPHMTLGPEEGRYASLYDIGPHTVYLQGRLWQGTKGWKDIGTIIYNISVPSSKELFVSEYDFPLFNEAPYCIPPF